MTPAEFDSELARVSVVCGKCWDNRDSEVRLRWVAEIRRMFEPLDYAVFHQAVSMVIDTHTDPRQLPTPARLRECYNERRPRHTTYAVCVCCGRNPCHHETPAGKREWLVMEAASMRPSQAARTLAAAKGRITLDAEVEAILKEIASSEEQPREPQTCVSGPKCTASKCIAKRQNTPHTPAADGV